jgi:hypothetical protein
MNERAPALRKLLILAIGVAMAGSLWAALADEGCDACGRSAALVGGLNLGAVGVGYYGLLLLTAIALERGGSKHTTSVGSLYLRFGVLIAAGVHLALLVLLVRNRILCPPCLVTAAGALTAATAALLQDRRYLPRAAMLLGAVVVVTYAGTKVLRQYSGSTYARQAIKAARAIQAERALLAEQGRPPKGHARMVVYVWPPCQVCRRFKAEVVVPLRKEFRGQLTVEERTVWKGMARPTVIVLGQKNTRFLGATPIGTVRGAIRLACGTGQPREVRAAGMPLTGATRLAAP